MAKHGVGMGTYIFGAIALFYVFGDHEKAETNNTSSDISTANIQKKEPKITQPASIISHIKKQSEIKVVSLPKNVVQKQKIQSVISNQTKTMFVDASRLNVRNQAGKQGKIIWTLKRHQKVKVTNKSGDWLFVEGTRFKGWVFGTYLTNNPAPKQVIIPQKRKIVNAELSTSQIKNILIKRSHAYYSGNCPCLYNTTSRGRSCGKRSAYSRPGGASPLCYSRDVTAQMVANYRARQ